MSFSKLTTLAVAMGTAFALAAPASAVTEIQWWHAMTGALGDRINDIAKDFNAAQSDYKVVPVFKGSYPETFAAAVAAIRAGNAPHIVQVQEVATATMMGAKKAVYPVHELMRASGEKFDPKGYVSAVTGYYSDNSGNMVSFPFNSSTTVFYYNKDAFKRAGLNPAQPPATWPEVMAAAAKLKVAGEKCAYTSTWQSWVHLENFSAWHNTAFASKNNGFGGTDARLVFNSPLHVKHISNMADWAKKGYFTYGGRTNEAASKFFSGECAMLTESSAGYANIVKNAKFEFGVGPLPYYREVAGAPQNTIIGGASLFVLNGKPAADYKGVAKFFTFLSLPERQATWHQQTGYLPVTPAAYEVTKKSGFYDKNPGTDVSVKQMIEKNATPTSRGLRLGNFIQIRAIIDEELENVWTGKQDAKTALDNAVKRGNEQLEKFQQANK